MTNSLQGVIVGVDMGGSYLNTILMDRKNNIIGSEKRRTPVDERAEGILEAIVRQVMTLIENHHVPIEEILGLGIACAGACDPRRGLVMKSPNIPCLNGYPLESQLSNLLQFPVFMDNDLNLAALGEHRFGVGIGTKHMFFLGVGTGIGGGIILDGRIYRGSSGSAGEIGHMVLQPDGPVCLCGNAGCLEALASGRGLASIAQDKVQFGSSSVLSDLVAGDTTKITAEVVFEGARLGDWIANQVVQEAAHFLGIGLSNLVQILSPEMIVVGGGVAQQWDYFLKPAIEKMSSMRLTELSVQVPVVPSALGGQAGALGAAALVADQKSKT